MNFLGHKFGHKDEAPKVDKIDFSKSPDVGQFPTEGVKIDAPRAVEAVVAQGNVAEQAVASTVEVTPVEATPAATEQAVAPVTELPSVETPAEEQAAPAEKISA